MTAITPELRWLVIRLPAFEDGEQISFMLGAFAGVRPHPKINGCSEILLSTGGDFAVLECGLPARRAIQDIEAQARLAP